MLSHPLVTANDQSEIASATIRWSLTCRGNANSHRRKEQPSLSSLSLSQAPCPAVPRPSPPSNLRLGVASRSRIKNNRRHAAERGARRDRECKNGNRGLISIRPYRQRPYPIAYTRTRPESHSLVFPSRSRARESVSERFLVGIHHRRAQTRISIKQSFPSSFPTTGFIPSGA